MKRKNINLLSKATRELSRVVAFVATLTIGSALWAQSTFVITNGEAQKRKFAEVGTYYLAITQYGSNAAVEATTQFSPRCVWHRTGKTGYYYQTDDDGNTYFLERNGQNLRITQVVKGAILSSTTSWYDWSFGVATQELGGDASYHWIVTSLDASGNVNGWRASGNTYGRPGFDESKGISGKTIDGYNTDGTPWTYGNSAITNDQISNDETRAYGLNRAATFTPVDVNLHDVEAEEVSGGIGELSFGDNYPIFTGISSTSLNASAPYSTYSAKTTPAYTQYTLYEWKNPALDGCDDYRYDNSCPNANGYYGNLGGDYEQYTKTVKTTNYWYNGGLQTAAPQAPSAASSSQPTRFEWVLSGPGAQYLSFESSGNVMTKTVSDNLTAASQSVDIYCTSDFPRSTTATLTLFAYYADGSTQQQSTTLQLVKFTAPTAVDASDLDLARGTTANLSVSVSPADAYQGYSYAFASVEGATLPTLSLNADNTLLVDATNATPGRYSLTLTAQYANHSNSDKSQTISVTVHPEAPDGVNASVAVGSSTLNAFTLDGNNITYSIYYTQTSTITDPATVVLSDLTLFSTDSPAALTPNRPLYAISVVTSGESVIRSLTAYRYLPTINSGVETGTSGNIAVVLNDLEDHSWSYYSDPECPIHSLNPADVKITYYGNGIVMTNSNDYTAATASSNYVSLTPSASNVTFAKVNIGGEDQNTFIYYKTLERTDGETATSVSGATGRCLYTTIPNPFQVRPTYGTTTTKWRGFQCWRVKSVSGGSIYTATTGGTALATNAIINAETDIYFAPTSEYGMEVELEAVWARAYVQLGSANMQNNSRSSQMERNFHIVNSQNATASSYQKSYPTVVSAYYPDGSTPDGTTLGTLASGDFTAAANTKFENININIKYRYEYDNSTTVDRDSYEGTKITIMGKSATYVGEVNSGTYTAACHNLVFGRGVTGGILKVVGYSTNPSSATSYTIRLESGNVNNFYLGSTINTRLNTTLSAKSIFGSDYDRANNQNSLLHIGPTSIQAGEIYGGNIMSISSQNNRNNLTFDWVVKSGWFNDTLNVGRASGGDESIYLGSSQSSNNKLQYIGKRRMLVEGGVLSSIAGGMNQDDSENYTVNSGKAVEIRIKGGRIKGSIYGAAAFAGAYGDRKILVTGGQIDGWIAGGANGTATSGGELYGKTNLYIGGVATVGYQGENDSTGTYVGGNCSVKINNTTTYGENGAEGGNVFGAGCGILPTNSSFTEEYTSYKVGTVGRVNESCVVVSDEAVVYGNVYGGGNYGWVRDNGRSDIYVFGGNVKGKVFGGSNNQRGQTVNIEMRGGQVEGGIYGGSNTWGYINNDITITVKGGIVGTDEENTANIHGGGYGQNTITNGNVTIYVGEENKTTGPTIYGDVFGGSALGSVNGGSVSVSNGTGNNPTVTLNTTYKSNQKTMVTVYSGTILGKNTQEGTGTVYGGGLGNDDVASNVYAPVTVTINGGKMNNVFGCNNVNGKPQGTVAVNIHGGEIGNVYGGGNKAEYGDGISATQQSAPAVTMDGGHVLYNVFGGGLGSSAKVDEHTDVKVLNGTVDGNVYGGGSQALVTGNTNVQIGIGASTTNTGN